MNRRTQAQVALLAALVFLIVGAALLAVLGAGLIAGVTGSGALLLGALTAGVFALAIRLIFLARTMRREPDSPPARSRRAGIPATPSSGAAPSASGSPAATAKPAKPPKPRPRPATHPGSRTH